MARWSAVTLFSTLSLLAPVVDAQEADADEARLRARALAEKGDAAFAAGRCDQAIPLWSQAEETFHAPTIQLRIANCYALLGKVVQAERVLTLIAGERLPADAPDAFRTAQDQAVATLPTVRSRIATIEVAVHRASVRTKPRVFVDDEPVAAGVARVQVDPGRHRVRVEAGAARWETSVQVEERGHAHVAAALREEVAPAPARPQRTVGLILGGVGLATAAVGSFFGVRALGTSSSLKDVCGPHLDDCPADRQGDIDQVNRDSKVADITMAAGGVLFLAGAVVMVTEPTPEREAPTLRIVPVGLGAGLRGAF
jgi:hypothetical protein